jgi:myo-inositol 2-dehydrogenase/D-chiro-inositol 1-dehydrogenase
MIGAGGIARTHARVLQAIPEAQLVSVFDIDGSRAEALAAGYDAQAYDNPEECIATADAVYILTPPSSHRELTLKAIETGKNVLCEKPISISIGDAEAMVIAAREADVRLMTAFNQRFRKGFKRLKEIIDSGVLGDIVTYWCQRIGMGVPRSYNWRIDPELMCGMTIESLSHDIDLIRWMLGDIANVRATLLASQPGLPGFDDHAHAVFALVNGATAIMHATWSSQIGLNSRGVVGTKGSAYVAGPGLWNLMTFHWKTEEMAHEMVEVIGDTFDDRSYVEENQHFIDCIVGGLSPAITGEDGLAALQVSHAMHQSHQNDAVVAVQS